MTIPGWLHAAAWLGFAASVFVGWWLDRHGTPVLEFWRGWVRGTADAYLTAALFLLLVSGCPPARATELRWTAPLALHAAAWWCAALVLLAIPVSMLCVGVMNPRTRPVFLGGLIIIAVWLLCWFVFECPPAHSATQAWMVP